MLLEVMDSMFRPYTFHKVFYMRRALVGGFGGCTFWPGKLDAAKPRCGATLLSMNK